MLQVEIYYYGATQPIAIPLAGSDRPIAEAFLERLRWDVIEAQRHSQRRLWITPFDRTQEGQAVAPSEIQRVVLVDRPSTDDTSNEDPATCPPPAGTVTDSSADTAVQLGARSPTSQVAPPEVAALPRNNPPVAPLRIGPRRLGAAIAPLLRRRAAKSQRRRTRWLALASLSVFVVLALLLTLVHAAGREPSTGLVAAPTPSTDAPVLPLLPGVAQTPSEQLSATITALADLATRDPEILGPKAAEVLASLRHVELLDGAPRRSAAVAANTSVGAAVAGGELDAGVGMQVQEVLDSVARPERLVDLVQLVGTDPLAIGPGGPALLDPLVALDHQVPADETAASAAALLQVVTNGAAKGDLSEAFQTVAVPTLQELADPAPYRALQELVADVERDPILIGPAGQQVLDSLRAIAAEPVYPQGNRTLDLLGLVLQDGQVTPAFRDTAIPVLEALVR